RSALVPLSRRRRGKVPAAVAKRRREVGAVVPTNEAAHAPSRRVAGDGVGDHLQIAQNLVVPEPDHPVAALFEPSCPSCVVGTLEVLLSVQFDHVPVTQTDEVDDEASDRVLTTETTSQLSAPECGP